MGWAIHVRQPSPDDEPMFRIWSTVVDGYISSVMTEEAAREFFLEAELKVALDNFERFWERELPIAKEFGTNHYNAKYDTSTLRNPDWNDERPL